MKTILFVFFILFSFNFISCSESSNPILNKENIYPVTNCKNIGLEIVFEDTCSYNFVISFLSDFDSVFIRETLLGGYFYIYADSGNYDYWLNYFENDSSILYIDLANSSSDSLILKFILTGKKSIEEEKQRFLSIKNLQIIKIEEQPKQVNVGVPENTESEWEEIFYQYTFVSDVYLISVCTES